MRIPSSILLLLFVVQFCLAASDLERAYDASERGDLETAVKIWRKLAAEGDSTAQLNLGQAYRLGKGVEVDDEQAVKWYTLAARQGSEPAGNYLQMMYKQHRASREDLDLAVTGQTHPREDREIEYQLDNGTQKSPANDWLGRLSAEQYLLQINASTNKQALEQYATKHLGEVRPQPRVLLTTHKGKDWYVLLMGPFDTRKRANEMLGRLPSEVKKGKPWIRKVSSVQ